MSAVDTAPPPAADRLPELPERTIAVVWPGIAAFVAGRLVGRLAGMQAGRGPFRLGRLLAGACIPLALAVYAWRLMPFVARRYRITNRRVVIQRGLRPVEQEAIELDRFDAVDVDVLPGQAWLRAGELVFRREGAEVFRLAGVSHPRTVRQVILDARLALVSLREVLRQQGE